jgi:3',5'-cyclic AMP phosphodiesterase CpdA
MLIAHISDLHIKSPGRKAYGLVDTARALERTIETLNTRRPRADLLLISGDLVDSGREDEYRQLKALLARLDIPCYLAIGNHDDRATLRTVFGKPHPTGDSEFFQYRQSLGELELIVLDTSHPPASNGHLCASRLNWLASALEQTRAHPVLIMMHHPPFASGIGHMDALRLDEASTHALAQLISGYPNVERILCGHLHRHSLTRFAGSIVQSCPSTAHQVVLDLSADAASAFTLEPPSYLLHHWHPDSGLVSHHALVDSYPGPYPFFDETGRLIE